MNARLFWKQSTKKIWPSSDAYQYQSFSRIPSNFLGKMTAIIDASGKKLMHSFNKWNVKNCRCFNLIEGASSLDLILSAPDISAQTFHYGEISPHVPICPVDVLGHKYISSQWTFQHWYFSAQEFLGIKTFQHGNVSARGYFFTMDVLAFFSDLPYDTQLFFQVAGCDTFGPKHMWSPDIWSPTIGPQLIGPSGQTVPNQFCPHGQMVPKNLVPVDKWSPTNLVPLDKWSPKI